MTSGQFQSFPLDQIIINRPERQRRTLEKIEELAESITRIGLIHPPVITRDGELKVGERRVSALRSLGWTHTPVQFVEDMNESELQLLELEENVRRVDLPWQDQCLAVERYHTLRSKESGWTQEKTADALGFSRPAVSDYLTVAQSIHSDKIAKAPKYSVARNIVRRETARRQASQIDAALEVPEKSKEPPLLNADFHEWVKTYSGSKFNMIHCDFPYGVGADKHDQGAASYMGGYEDSPEVYWKLLKTLREAMDNVVHDSAHLMFWFSMDYYHETQDRLEEMGWKVDPFPFIWLKSDNNGILPDPDRGPRRIYETCFFGSRGDRKIVRAVSNAFASPTTKLIHMSEKPVPVLNHFMRMIVDEYSTVLDPTCGSGNSCRTAAGLGAATVLGIERNEEFYNLAKEHFFDA